ncbi:MAG: cytochrome c3 family protein [Nannocystaceae bacterium]
MLRALVLCVLSLVAAAAAATRLERVAATRAWLRARAALVPGHRGGDRYLGSDGCRGCHPAAWRSWHGSYHRTMTQPASRATVLPPWSDTTLPGGIALGFDGAAPVVVREGAHGRTRQAVAMLTGSHHLQLFWLHDPGTDTLQAFEYAWLVDEARFVPNVATLVQPPGLDPIYTWNRICIRCHAVAGSPGWHEATGRVDTRVVELGIACEACHGPARAHAEHHRDPVRRWLARGVPDDIVQPASLSPQAATEICAQCHSISLDRDEVGWLAHGPDHAPPDALAGWTELVQHPARSGAPSAALARVLLDDPEFLAQRFWPDGMVRVTGRETNALQASRCAAPAEPARTISCLSCHSLHHGSRDDQLRPQARGDQACTQCHDDPALTQPGHSHHAADSEGARCMNCHMPHTAWGLLGAIRSHEIDTPDPEPATASGRPLACTLCHIDRPAAWAQRWLLRWRGEPGADPQAATGPADAVAGLLAGEAGVRALWAWHLGWAPARVAGGERWQAALLAEALLDPYPAVRAVAWRSLVQLLPDAPRLPDGVLPGAGERAWALAAARAHAPDRSGDAVLRRGDGSLDDARVRAWMAQRDPQPITLAE